MKYSMLKREAIFLLKKMKSLQGNARGCVVESLDQVIRNLEAIDGKGLSEPELAAIILKELELLFSSFPEIKEQLTNLARL